MFELMVSMRSTSSYTGNPIDNKDYRCNTSIILKFKETNESECEYKNIIIDVGKTFRESITRWFPNYDIRTIDAAAILTHYHADAIFGLDEMRCLQEGSPEPLNVYLTNECKEVVSQVFYYLFPKYLEKLTVCRPVSNIRWIEINDLIPFTACGLQVVPLPGNIPHTVIITSRTHHIPSHTSRPSSSDAWRGSGVSGLYVWKTRVGVLHL